MVRPLKIYLTLALLLLLQNPRTLHAQSANYFRVNLGINNTALRDKSMSPLKYAGPGFSAALSFEHSSEKRTEIFIFSFDQAGIGNQYQNTCDYKSGAMKNYNFYHKHKGRDRRIVPGWSNHNYFNYYVYEHFSNFSERSNYMTTFGPAAAYRYRFTLFGREMAFDLLLDVQLIGFYLRPSYVSNNPEGYLDPDNSGFMGWLRSIDLFFPHQAWNAEIGPTLTYYFRSGNALSLNYQYQYLRINDPEPYAQSSGKWYLTLVTKL